MLDDRLERQAPAVRVARQRAAEAQAVGARLLLDDAPLARHVALRALEVFEQRRPQDAALDGDEAALGVEGEHPVERARIDEHAGLAELLPAHRVASAGDRHRLAVATGPRHGRCQFAHRARPDDRGDARGVQLRVDVVDERAGTGVRGGLKRQGSHALRLRDSEAGVLRERLKKP